MNPFLLLGVAIVLLVIFYFLFRRQTLISPKPIEGGNQNQDMYVFDPTSDAIKPPTRRKATITAPDQTIKGARRKLSVEARPLPSLPHVRVPEGKGIDGLVVLVGDFRVHSADTREELYEFDPPLTFTFEYTREDAAAAPSQPDGTPRLSIITGYEADDGWKFERLPTSVTPDGKTGGGTLTAQVKTLHPKDPHWAGFP